MADLPTVHKVAGVRLSAAKANIRYADRLDLVLMELHEDSTVAGVFTRNVFCAAPVHLARKHLQAAGARYLLINTGNANAGTGEAGTRDALRCCDALARIAQLKVDQILPFSTGVIGEPLPVEKIVDALPGCYGKLSADSWEDAARGIMTTDTRPKLFSTQLTLGGKVVNITGIAKGAGMLKPNMATMLAFVCTDLNISRDALQSLLNQAVQGSFNRITVDGDTSTNDCAMLVATGQSGCALDALSPAEREQCESALMDVFRLLAVALIKDAEGATKFITIMVENGANKEECLQVAYTIAESPLVKTALFASDPNWGRILAAVGRAGLHNLDISKVEIFLGTERIVQNGAVAPEYREELGQKEMDKAEITISVKLGRGSACETVWTSDLSHEYIRINAEYRT